MKSTEAANIVMDSIKRGLSADPKNNELSRHLEAMAWRFLPAGSIVAFSFSGEGRAEIERNHPGGFEGFIGTLGIHFKPAGIEVLAIADYLTKSMDLFLPKDKDRALELIAELEKLTAWRSQTTETRDERWNDQQEE